MPKVLKSICRKLWCLSIWKNSTSSLTSFLIYCKDIATIGTFGNVWQFPPKSWYQFVSNLSCLSACKKSTSSLAFFLRYCKLVILGNLGMPGQTHLKWQYQSEETFDIILQHKYQLHPSCFLWNIAKIFQTCCFGYFGHAWLCTTKVMWSSCTQLPCLSGGKKSTSSPCFLEILHRYCTFLFWVLWACLVTHNQNDNIKL